MHVLHIIDTLGLGGAERMLVDLANASVADGHRVSVCVTRSDITLAHELDPTVEVLVLDRRKRFSVSASIRLASWVRSRKVEVVHVHLRHTLLFVLLLRAVAALRIPIVFHDHYGSIETDVEVPRWFRVGHRLIDHYVGVHEKLCEWAMTAGMPAERTTTIPNALDLTRLARAPRIDLRAELGLDPGTSIGLLVATIRPDKGVATLIEAIALTRQKARLRVLIAGATGDSTYAAACKAKVQEHGLGDVITFLGPRSDVPSLLAAVDFGILASHSESGPLVLIEYLDARLSIVSTSVGNIGRRLAAMDVPGFVPPRDPAALAAAIDELLHLSTAERAARGELGRAALERGWDLRATMPRWYEVYRAAIAR